jgi:hypothetical protein
VYDYSAAVLYEDGTNFSDEIIVTNSLTELADRLDRLYFELLDPSRKLENHHRFIKILDKLIYLKTQLVDLIVIAVVLVGIIGLYYVLPLILK